MTERAVFVPDLDRVPAAEPFDRLYLGSEFCHWRLPSAAQLHDALSAAAVRGAAFSLVTPFLDEGGLAQAVALVRSLPADGATEVVANDVGLLEAVREAGWSGTVVAGRLLTKQRRGPGVQEPAGATAEALEALRGSALDSAPLVAWLGEEYGVRRFELDELAQGTAVPPLPEGVRLSLYRPWALVTATRNCPWVFDGRTWDRLRGCARPCRARRLELTLPPPPPPDGGGVAGTTPAPMGKNPRPGDPMPTSPSRGEGGVGVARTRPLVLGGCAQFLRVDTPGGPLPPGVDRVVWQPDIPA